MEASSRASWQGLLPAPDSGAINKARGNDLVGGAVWQSGGGGTGEDAPGVQVCISAPNVTNRATHDRKRPCMSQSFTFPCKPPMQVQPAFLLFLSTSLALHSFIYKHRRWKTVSLAHHACHRHVAVCDGTLPTSQSVLYLPLSPLFHLLPFFRSPPVIPCLCPPVPQHPLPPPLPCHTSLCLSPLALWLSSLHSSVFSISWSLFTCLCLSD